MFRANKTVDCSAIFDQTWYQGLPLHCDIIIVKHDIHRKVFVGVSIHNAIQTSKHLNGKKSRSGSLFVTVWVWTGCRINRKYLLTILYAVIYTYIIYSLPCPCTYYVPLFFICGYYYVPRCKQQRCWKLTAVNMSSSTFRRFARTTCVLTYISLVVNTSSWMVTWKASLL